MRDRLCVYSIALSACAPTTRAPDPAPQHTIDIVPAGVSSVDVVADEDERPAAGLDPAVPLDVVVHISSDGFAVTAQGKWPGHACGERSEKVSLRLLDGQHDYAGLRACLTVVRGSHPAFAGEQGLTISADAGVRYQVVIETMDAVRETDAGTPLFPDVRFGVRPLP